MSPFWRFCFNISFFNMCMPISFFLSLWPLKREAGNLEHWWILYYHYLTLGFPVHEQHSASKLCFFPVLSASPFLKCAWLFPDRNTSIIRSQSQEISASWGTKYLMGFGPMKVEKSTMTDLHCAQIIHMQSWWAWQIGRINWQYSSHPADPHRLFF